MAQDSLLAALEEDARNQSGRILEEAEESARALMNEAKEAAEVERSEKVMELEERLRRERASRLNAARMKASGLKLKVRNGLIGETIDEAARRFGAIPKDEHAKLVNRLFDELKKAWSRERPDETPVALLNPSDIGIIKDDGTVFRPDGEVSLGAVFTSADGRVRYYNTVGSRLEKALSTIKPAVNEMLFGEVL